MTLSIIEEYIETGNFQDLELALMKNPELAHKNTSHHISPLLLSCYYQKPQITQTILKYIKTITIHEACAAGLIHHVRMMVEHKKEVIHELSDHGLTALGIATHFNQEDIVKYLLKQQADPNVCSQNGFHIYPIHTASYANNENICRLLMDAEADINVQQHGGYTPLHFAASHGNIDLIIALLERGSKIAIQSDQQETAADLALKKGFKDIAEILKSTS